MSSTNCTLSGTFTINPGATGPVATVTTTASCGGSAVGTATATATGGVTPYTYSWNTTPARTTQTITGLIAGTYTVTVTDNAGCAATASGTVSGAGNLTVNMSKTDITCNGLTNGTATATTASGTSPYTYSWNTTPPQTTQTVSSLAAGSYTAVVTDANGCSGTGSVTINTPAVLSVAASQTTAVACNGGATGAASATASGGTAPYTYSWNTNPVRTTAAITGLTAGSYTVTVTDAKGCIQAGTTTVTQPSALAVTTSATTNPCAGVPGGSATATPAGGTPPYTYSWNTTPVQTTQTATGINSGTYTVTVRDANLCVKTATATVAQTPALSGSFTQISQPLCPNVNNGSATYAATGGTQPYTYSWNNGQIGPTATGLAAGTYIVSVRDGSGCLHTASVNINNGSVLRTSITTTQPNCFGAANGTATVTATGGRSPYTYSWATTPPQTGTTATGLPAGSWIVSVRDALGCVVPDTAVIGQPPALTATIQTVDVQCFNQRNGTATATVTGGTAPYTYIWNTTQVQTGSTATGLDAGTFDVQITDSKGCTTTNTFTINQPAELVLTTGVRGSNCLGQNNGRAYVTVAGGVAPYTYRWTTNPGQTTDTAVGLASGSYAVTVTDRNGCQRTATAVIPTPVPLVATVTIDQVPCPGRPEGKLTGQASGGSGAYRWSWNTVPAQTTQSVSGLLPGLYTLTVSDTLQCVAIVNVDLPAHTPPTVSAGPDKTICSGRPVTLDGSGTAISWNWSPATALSCITCLTPVSSTQVNRQYVLSGTDANGCVASDTVQVRVINRQPVAVGPSLKICPGDSVQLTASGATAYRWSPAASLNDSTIAMPIAKPVQTTRYRVVLSQDVCYVDTLYQQIDVYNWPTIDLPESIASIYGGKVALSASVTDATAITWSPATGLSCSNCFEPIATITGSITYTATVQNELGCATSDSVSILVNCNGDRYYFPTAFVPEGDGENRWFFPKSKEQGRIRSLKIYNRWGALVFESGEMPLNNPQGGWDGRQNGQPAPQGVYVYMAEVQCDNGQTARLDGNVTLMR
jgi:gliding motility-associated-like protein